MTTLLAYPGGIEQRAAIVAELQAHADADRLVKGQYWENGKGCAVGCTIKSGDHAEYESRFGIPMTLAHLEDAIFENLPNADAMRWPMRFMLAPKPGADLTLVQWKFLEFVVGEVLSRPEAASVREACQPALNVIAAAARGEPIDEIAAESAAGSAASAARSAAGSARSAAESAESAAWSAESAAWSAAWSAESAARSAAWSAERSAESAESAESAAWARYADKLIELMAAAPVTEQSA